MKKINLKKKIKVPPLNFSVLKRLGERREGNTSNSMTFFEKGDRK